MDLFIHETYDLFESDCARVPKRSFGGLHECRIKQLGFVPAASNASAEGEEGNWGGGGGGGPDNTPNSLVCRYAKSGCTAWPASVATLPVMALVAIACYGSCVLWQLRVMAVVCRKQ